MSEEALQLRVHGDAALPTLIYLPGIHGDWTLIGSLRARLAGKVRFVEITYPRTLAWSLADYAAAVEEALLKHDIADGTLLAESFGSQVAWALIERCASSHSSLLTPHFQPNRLILAGGFARYPILAGVRATRWMFARVSMATLARMLLGYAKFARYRHRHAPETLADIDAFIARRTPLDRDAALHRLNLIHANDPWPVARAVNFPVFALTGGIDPVVPWPFVLPWLRRHCPTLRATKVLWRADHNVLSTDPESSAHLILRWLGDT